MERGNTNRLVKLVSEKDYSKEVRINIDHALRLLLLKNSVWSISDKRYIFENNEIKRQKSKRKDN